MKKTLRIISADSLADRKCLSDSLADRKCLSDYFWFPMAPNDPLFDVFIIEFDDFAPNLNAVV